MEESDGLVTVFVYGSLLDPASFARTVVDTPASAGRVGRVAGWRRVLGVAFPNDGSEPDKAYRTERGHRPPVVLFADLRPDRDGWVNGVVVDVSHRDLARIRARERRYVPGPVEVDVDGHAAISALTWRGKPAYTRRVDIDRGRCAHDYWTTILAGAAHWDRRAPGFLDDFRASTDEPPPERLMDLLRWEPRRATPT